MAEIYVVYTIIFDANSIAISRIHYVLVAVSVGSFLSLLFLRVFCVLFRTSVLVPVICEAVLPICYYRASRAYAFICNYIVMLACPDCLGKKGII